MEINQNRAYITLKMVDGQVGMYVSRMTEAVRDIGLSCGDVLSGTRAGINPVTIESCQLNASEFLAWLRVGGLDAMSCKQQYEIIAPEVVRWLLTT